MATQQSRSGKESEPVGQSKTSERTLQHNTGEQRVMSEKKDVEAAVKLKEEVKRQRDRIDSLRKKKQEILKGSSSTKGEDLKKLEGEVDSLEGGFFGFLKSLLIQHKDGLLTEVREAANKISSDVDKEKSKADKTNLDLNEAKIQADLLKVKSEGRQTDVEVRPGEHKPQEVVEASAIFLKEFSVAAENEVGKIISLERGQRLERQKKEQSSFQDLKDKLERLNNEDSDSRSQSEILKAERDLEDVIENEIKNCATPEFNEKIDEAKKLAADSSSDPRTRIKLGVLWNEAIDSMEDVIKRDEGTVNEGLVEDYTKRAFEKLMSSVKEPEEVRMINDMIAQKRADIAKMDVSKDAEKVHQANREIRSLEDQKNMFMTQLTNEALGAGRGNMMGGIESPPTDKDAQMAWVLKKIHGIMRSGVSPSMLVYFPGWSSLLYNLETLGPELSAFISAWRTNYELNLIFETTSSPTDLLSHAPGAETDYYCNSIGKKDKDGNYTNESEAIMKAMVLLDEYGELMTLGDERQRQQLHKMIAKKLNDDLPEGEKFGFVFEKMGYALWKQWGRECIFDDIVYDRINPDGSRTRIVGSTKENDEEVRRQAKMRLPGEAPIPEKYITYKGKSRFWMRKDLDLTKWFKQQPGFVYAPELDNAIDGYARDFYTDRLAPASLKKSLRDSSGSNFTANKSIKKLTMDMLKGTDWENIAYKYSIWVDKLNKTHMFAGALSPFRKNLELTPDIMVKIRETAAEYIDEPDKTVLRNIGETILNLNKEYSMPKLITEDVYLPDGTKSKVKHYRLARSKLEEYTGRNYNHMNYRQMVSSIGLMEDKRIQWLDPLYGEELLRRWYGIGPKTIKEVKDVETGKIVLVDMPLIPGIGMVREAKSTALSLLGVLFDVVGKMALYLIEDVRKSK